MKLNVRLARQYTPIERGSVEDARYQLAINAVVKILASPDQAVKHPEIYGVDKISAQEYEEVRNEYGGICPYCNRPVVNGEFDHIVPVTRGGRNIRENLVYCCSKCNRSKSNQGLLAFLGR